MTMYEAGSITKHEVEIPVRVDDQGRWHATYEGNSVDASSKSALAAQVGKLAKKATVKVEIRFTILDQRSYAAAHAVKRGTATSIHARSGQVMVRWDNGSSEQLTGYPTTLGDLTPDEATQWVTLNAAQRQATEAMSSFVKAREINLNRVVRDAIDKAAEAADKEQSS
jgi:hypothetical protein